MPTYDKLSTKCSNTLNERLYHSELLTTEEKSTFSELQTFVTDAVALDLTKPESVIMGMSGCTQDSVIITTNALGLE